MKWEVQTGFTIAEMIVTIVIVSIFAGFAIPRLGNVIETFRATEGDQILLTLLSAQERFRIDTGGYTNNINNLDLSIRPPDNFNMPTVSAVLTQLASIQRNGIPPYQVYTLQIGNDAQITCIGGAGICPKLGYPKN